MSTAGGRFRQALAAENPLQIVGAINAYAAIMAESVGYRALYLSGGGVANASYGLPDLGMTTLNDVLEDVRRITAASRLPLLVDVDTGWGGAFNIARAIREMIRAGAGAVHIEDQVAAKRCGHRPNKAIVSAQEMCDRIKAAADAKTDAAFVVMARTDALAVEGLDAVVERAARVEEAGGEHLPYSGSDLREEAGAGRVEPGHRKGAVAERRAPAALQGGDRFPREQEDLQRPEDPYPVVFVDPAVGFGIGPSVEAPEPDPAPRTSGEPRKPAPEHQVLLGSGEESVPQGAKVEPAAAHEKGNRAPRRNLSDHAHRLLDVPRRGRGIVRVEPVEEVVGNTAPLLREDLPRTDVEAAVPLIGIAGNDLHRYSPSSEALSYPNGESALSGSGGADERRKPGGKT